MNPLEPYLIWIKLAAGAVVIGILIWAGLTVRGWHQDSLSLTAVKAERDEIAAQAQSALKIMGEQQRASYAASEGFQREIKELRDRPVPARVVRVLVPAGKGVPAAGPAARRPDAGAAPAGVVQPGPRETASRDIGPDLYALALEADRCSAQLRGLQAWVEATR